MMYVKRYMMLPCGRYSRPSMCFYGEGDCNSRSSDVRFEVYWKPREQQLPDGMSEVLPSEVRLRVVARDSRLETPCPSDCLRDALAWVYTKVWSVSHERTYMMHGSMSPTIDTPSGPECIQDRHPSLYRHCRHVSISRFPPSIHSPSAKLLTVPHRDCRLGRPLGSHVHRGPAR